MLGKIGEAAQSQRLRHQAQVLEHHALLDSDELCHHQLQSLHGQHSSARWVVDQMTAAAAPEAANPRGLKIRPLVNDKGPGVLVENLQQPLMYMNVSSLIGRK